MAGTDYFSAGNDAFVDEEYDKAKENYSQAIKLEPDKSAYYFKRSICNFKLQDYSGSALDAESSIKLDSKNPKAYLRLGLAKFQLKEYVAAKEAFQNLLALDATSKEAQEWIAKCKAEIPDEPSLASEVAKPVSGAPDADRTEQKPVGKLTIKHDWYQTETHVVLTLMTKNRKKDDVEIEFGKQNLSITVKLSSDNDFNWELDLAHLIEPKSCIFRVLSTKIEIKMQKAEGRRWTSLECRDEPVYAKLDNQDKSADDSATLHYPSSSKKYHDWDKLAANVEKEDSEEKKEGDAALNELFQKIYANADDDTRRAMNKSYQESGGTVLSTNWKDIGKEKVQVKPPDGMEYKKYEI